MISAVIHTYNEETNIEDCLSSLNWTDEKIVVDMGSTDKTTQKAKRFGVKVHTFPYMGFADPARNFGLGQVKGDWVIVLDADERISKSLAEFLLQQTQKNTDIDYFRIPRKNIIFSKWIKHTGWWPDYQIRFFKKGAVSWSNKIHGVPITKGKGTDLDPIEKLSIIHYNYQSIEQYLNRLNRYTSIFAKELFLENQRFLLRDLFEKPSREFVNRFFVGEGFKDGVHGLALSFLQSFSELITYLKLWELEKFREEKISLLDTDKYLGKEYELKHFWLVDKLLKHVRYIYLH